MSEFLSMILNSEWFSPSIITAVALALSAGAVVISKKYGIKVINIGYSIVQFIRNTLSDLNIGNDRLNVLIDFIIQAILYAAATADENKDTEQKINEALGFIKNIAEKLEVRLSENELDIITIALKLGFIFINSLGVKTAKIKSLKKNYDKKIVKYIYNK